MNEISRLAAAMIPSGQKLKRANNAGVHTLISVGSLRFSAEFELPATVNRDDIVEI